MPLNDRKIISIIIEEMDKVDEECAGYREEIQDVIADIIEYERQHRVQGTNIQQKISDKISAAGRFLSERMNSK
jgi:hypothetical protein